jgi:hypothetical protein
VNLSAVLADADAVLSHPLTVTVAGGIVLGVVGWTARLASTIPAHLARLEERVISVGQKLIDHMAEEERQRTEEVNRIARIEDKLDRTLSFAQESHDRAHP